MNRDAPSRRSTLHPVARPQRPLLGVALIYLVGTVTGFVFPVAHLLSSTGALAAVILTLGIRARPRTTSILLLVAVFFAAWFRCGLALDPPGRLSLPHKMDRDSEALMVVGTVADDPYFVMDAGDPVRGTWKFRLNLEGVNRVGEVERIAGSATCRWDDARRDAEVSYGDRLEVDGVVRRSSILGIGAASRISVRASGDDARLLDQGVGSWLVRVCYEGRNHFARILSRGVHDFPDHLAILHALLLGYLGGMPDELQESFSLTGTLHIFAISGLHVGVVAGLICALLRVFMIPRHRWILVLAPLLILYALATGVRPSAVRACVMALAFWSAGLVSRKPDAPTALAVSAVLILAYDPLQLASMGFILSFSVVTGILLLFPIFYQPRIEVLATDPYLPPVRSHVREYARAALRWIWALAAVSLACWLVSFPLTARFFNVFSPVALGGNLFVVPLTFVVVVTGFLSMVTGLLSGWVSEVFNHANVVFVEILLRIVGVMADARGGHLFVRSPPWIWIICFYALVVGFAVLRDRRRWLVAMLAFTLLGGWLGLGAMGDVEGVGVLNRNGALSVDLSRGRGMPLLFDPGSRKRSHNLLSALREQGVNRIGVIVLSKVTFSRAGIVPELLDRCRVDEIMFARLDGNAELLEEILTTAEINRVKVSQLLRGAGAQVTSTARWEVLSPGVHDDVGDVPCVLRIHCKDVPLLVVADLSPTGAYHFQQMFSDLHALAVVEGAASYRGVHTEFFLESVGPSILLSPGRFMARATSGMARFQDVAVVDIIEGESVMLTPVTCGRSAYTISEEATKKMR